MKKDKIIIYTDGAARGNPGSAGWGAVFIMGGKVFEIGGGTKHATNNQMELTAAIEGLKYLPEFCKKAGLKLNATGIEIFADSKYVITGISEWIHNWMKNNWRTANKKAVLNQELWQELHVLNRKFKPKWHYVKSHNGNKYNDRADLIATSFADGNKIKLRK